MPTDQPPCEDDLELEARIRRIVEEIEHGEDDEGSGDGVRLAGGVGSPDGGGWATSEGLAADQAAAAGRRGHSIETAVREILTQIGEDPDREGLVRTPERMHRMWLELTAGYRVNPDKLINGAVFDVGYSEMVVIKGISFYSLCEHHMLPFFGTAAVGYLPRDRVVGLSKIPRIVEMYARRLQVQERMTQQIADFLQQRLNPYGVGVVIEAEHLCLAMRGVQKGGATMVTSSVLGTFRTTKETREEFMAHLERAVPRA